jgi:molybdopterin-synthase adenylyltransferase
VEFDLVKKHNLDRLNYATRRDVGRPKVDVLADHLRDRATAANFRALPIAAAVYQEEGYRAALDCDLLFACVDRPWGRYALNFIAYSHLIPVIDGRLRARTNRLGKRAAADWRAHGDRGPAVSVARRGTRRVGRGARRD